ncbi:MAG: 4-hydroxy-tetrahydrodipicolinate reductase [Planctomycetota bacterium]
MNQHQSKHLSLIVHGAAGRMGRRVVALSAEDDEIELVAAMDHVDHPLAGRDAGDVAGVGKLGVAVSADWPGPVPNRSVPVVIDFSLPVAIDGCVDACVRNHFPLVVATTGLESAHQERLMDASKSIPIVWAPSMSLAVNLSMKVTQQITSALRDVAGGLDIEIIERHHRFKADAPSGTALRFGELISQRLIDDAGDSAAIESVHGREGHTGQRTRREIGYHAVRVGDNPGEHTIVFGMLGETIEVNVAASNRDCYAAGAIAAARWLMTATDDGREPGMYDMFDVLGMSE